MIRRPCSTRASRKGFTLIEASLATMVVGVAFVAALQLIATGTMVNTSATSLTTGMNLARGVNEYLLQQKYSDLTGYNGATYTPPRDSRGHDIDGMDGWTQTISVISVDPTNLTRPMTDPTPAAVRITVTVSHNGNQICDLSWYVFDATP